MRTAKILFILVLAAALVFTTGCTQSPAGDDAGTHTIVPSVPDHPGAPGFPARITPADLVYRVKDAAAFAQTNGREAAFAAFNDNNGRFFDGIPITAVDFNGTILAGPLPAGITREQITLIDYHDPDGVATIREMRDLALQGGGFSYSVVALEKDGTTCFAPGINYIAPVDDTFWIFSGSIVPGYEQLQEGNITGIVVRNHTRAELQGLVDRAVIYAQENGKEMALAEISNPSGKFVDGDLFVWAEDFSGTILADPFWTEGVGKNWMDYTDPLGARTTVANIHAIRNGTGYIHLMFPDTPSATVTSIPKLVYARAVDDTWWIGSGIYGVQVAGP